MENLNALISAGRKQARNQEGSSPTRPLSEFSSDPASAVTASLHRPTSKSTPLPHLPLQEVPSLVSLCRSYIVTNLERYPAKALSYLPVDEFESLIRLRHLSTTPRNGSGGLDGTGRIAPALSVRFLALVEAENDSFITPTTDVLVWKDSVECRFRRGGMSRPRALLLPWPLLVKQIQDAVEKLRETATVGADGAAHQVKQQQVAFNVLKNAPMSVSLLHSTGVGKIVKKLLKLYSHNTELQTQLQGLLDHWKNVAANSGVEMKEKDKAGDSKHVEQQQQQQAGEDEEEDLAVAETCQSWRDLYRALKRREEARRDNQGKRMREIRKNLASDRRKVVKVRPVVDLSIKKNKWGITPSHAPGSATKINQLKQETSKLQQSRRGGASAASSGKSKSPGSSFGDAVAFAAITSKKKRKHGSQATVQLGGGKRMQVPTQVVQGNGGGGRAFHSTSSKFKTAR